LISLDIFILVHENTFESVLNLFNSKEKIKCIKISELKVFNLLKEEIENGKMTRAYTFEINKRYNKMDNMG
tara:strand:+ start:942 stop:1154 length:213 start_codon:yes stop_codon:yes gene_type:complete